MNNFYIIIFFVFAFSACDIFAGTRLIGVSDANGYAYIDRRLNGYNEEIPIDLVFSTDPEINFETNLGAYWHIPVMSTRIFDSGNGYITWITPTKKKVLFKKEDSKKLTDLGKFWEYIPNKDSITISSPNGSTSYIYKSDRLHSIQINNNIYKFHYSQGKLDKIHKNNGLYASFSYINGYIACIHLPAASFKYDFKYSVTDISESPLLIKILQNGKSVCELKYSRGTVGKDNDVYFDERVNVNIPTDIYRMTISASYNHWVEWDSATGILAKDSSGVYCIGSYIKNNNISYIAYKSNFSDYPEFAIMNYANSVKKHQNPRDGTMIKTSFIVPPRKFNMEIHNKEIQSNKSDKWEFAFSRIYDKSGRLISETNNKNETKNCRAPNAKDNGIYHEIVNGVTVKSGEVKSGKTIRETRILNGDVYEILYLDEGFLATKNGKKVEM